MRRLFVAGALALSGLGCEHRTHPWDPPDAGGPSLTETPPPPLLAVDHPADDAGAPDPDAAHDGGYPQTPGLRPDEPALPVRVGGPWVRCYGGFHPSGEPLKDVTRLSLLCGPENGMKRLSKEPLAGAVSAGGPPVTETFEARRGACYRVFAVAEPTVADLDVVVRSSRGSAIAADHGEDSWPIVQPDRPFCALEDDRYTVEVSAKRGSGRFAAEVWALHAAHAGREAGHEGAPARPRPGRNRPHTRGGG